MGNLRVPILEARNNKGVARAIALEPGPREECAPLASWPGSRLGWMEFVDSDPFPPTAALSMEILSRLFIALKSPDAGQESRRTAS